MTDVFSLEEKELAKWLENKHLESLKTSLNAKLLQNAGFTIDDNKKWAWFLTTRDLLKKQKEEIIGIIQKISDRLKMDSDELKMKKTSYDWNNGIITFREQLKSHFLDSEFFVCKGALKNEALAENDNGSDIFARITPVTANKSKSDLGETSDISASVAIPKPLKEEDLNYIVGYLTTKDVRLAVEWIVNKIEETNRGRKPVKEWEEYVKSDSKDYYEAWLVKKAFSEVMRK